MLEEEILRRAFAMPLTSPSYPPGPYRFVNREYLIITYRTDPVKLRAAEPEPLDIDIRERGIDIDPLDTQLFLQPLASRRARLDMPDPVAGTEQVF